MIVPNPATSSVSPIEILLVDDDDDDVRLTTKSLQNDRILNRIHRVEDGVEAIDFLKRQGRYSQAVRPDLILLDLNMPRMDGREVLRFIKSDDHLKTIPVLVLTTSEDEADIIRSYTDQANCYVTKPVGLMQFRAAISHLNDFWFTVVKFPPRPIST